MNQRFVHLDQVRMLILDEADRMLDMGFVNDVKKIIAKVPSKRQTLFFSATMPAEITSLANTILTNPERIEVTPVSSTADTIQQALYYVEKNDKKSLLIHILKDKGIKTALVFTRTKHGADKVVKDLNKVGITAEAIHGNKSQNARQRALTNFKNRTTRVLIATDIAARGIDIDELTHVVNYELPNIPETYVHRIGRTGRAGADGIAMSFCDSEEILFLRDIHKLIGKEIPVEEGHPYPMSPVAMAANLVAGQSKKGSGSFKREGGRGGSGRKPSGGGRSGGSRSGGNKSTGGGSGMSGASRSSGRR
jgi:ATP-dependent RNA helicase RhlE